MSLHPFYGKIEELDMTTNKKMYKKFLPIAKVNIFKERQIKIKKFQLVLLPQIFVSTLNR
jgi:hypothetical protein